MGEYGLTRGTCFLACRLELDAVVGLLWISGCVPRLADYSVFFVFDLFFLRTHTGWCMYEATSCLLYVSTGTEARPKERSDRGRFVPIGKKDSSYRGVYRVPLFNWSVCPSVCLSVCVSVSVCVALNSSFLLIARAVRGRFPQTRYRWKRASFGLTRGTCFFARRLDVVAVAGLLRLWWCVLAEVDFFVLSMSLHFQIHS